MNIQTRVDKLEERLGVNKAPESLEEMFQKLESGAYGMTLMSIVVFIMSGGSDDKLRRTLPAALIDAIRETLEKVPEYEDHKHNLLQIDGA